MQLSLVKIHSETPSSRTAREEKAGQGRGGRRRLEERLGHLFLCHSKVSAWVASALSSGLELEIPVRLLVIDFDFCSDIFLTSW